MKKNSTRRALFVTTIFLLAFVVLIQVTFAKDSALQLDNSRAAGYGSKPLCVSDSSSYWAMRYVGGGGGLAASIQAMSGGRSVFAGGVSDFWTVVLNDGGFPVMQNSFGGTEQDPAWSIDNTSDGGYIIGGNSSSFSGSWYNDIWILKLDSSGSVSWQRSYGGEKNDRLRMIRQTNDGGYIAAGTARDGSDDDILILRLDGAGDVQWQRKLGGDEYDSAFAVQQTPDDGFIMAGLTESFGEGNGSAWIIKLTSGGAISWQKTFGSGYFNRASSIVNIAGGGYMVAGYTAPSPIETRGWLFKLNTNGAVVWEKTYIEPPHSSLEKAIQTVDGGFIAVGTVEDYSAGTADIWLLKVDASGILQWSKKYDGGAQDHGYSVDQMADGGYIVSGSAVLPGPVYRMDPFVLRLDGNGSIPNCANISTASVSVYSSSPSDANTAVVNRDFALTTNVTNGLEDVLDLVAAPVCGTVPAFLDVNYVSGAPGSYFTLSGSYFPITATVDISVNSWTPGTVASDSEGEFSFLLSTTSANEGVYIVRVSSGSAAAVSFFTLEAAEPVRPQEGSGPIFDVPSGIALSQNVYLPTLMKK